MPALNLTELNAALRNVGARWEADNSPGVAPDLGSPVTGGLRKPPHSCRVPGIDPAGRIDRAAGPADIADDVRLVEAKYNPRVNMAANNCNLASFSFRGE